MRIGIKPKDYYKDRKRLEPGYDYSDIPTTNKCRSLCQCLNRHCDLVGAIVLLKKFTDICENAGIWRDRILGEFADKVRKYLSQERNRKCKKCLYMWNNFGPLFSIEQIRQAGKDGEICSIDIEHLISTLTGA